MRIVAFAAFAAAFAVAGPAAAAGLPFDPEAATRAWLDTMGPEATARSNAYFEGGYIIDFAGTALSIIVPASSSSSAGRAACAPGSNAPSSSTRSSRSARRSSICSFRPC
jgi:hypothetical protein